jgi:hypothetical protein
VTCNFNDVHNSRVEVRPDRAYLKQQLKAVEARVVAIQEKKRKLDQRMSVLTDGLKVRLALLLLLPAGGLGGCSCRLLLLRGWGVAVRWGAERWWLRGEAWAHSQWNLTAAGGCSCCNSAWQSTHLTSMGTCLQGT